MNKHTEGLKMKYFVLKPRSKGLGDKYAKASRDAMEAYAHSIVLENQELAEELFFWTKRETSRAVQYKAKGGS